MTAPDAAAFRTGLLHAADLALVTALSFETREDARHVRQQVAISALRGLAEALKEQLAAPFDEPSPNARRTSLRRTHP